MDATPPDLQPELRTISLPPPPSLPITRHHLHQAPLSVTPRAFNSKSECHLFKHSYPDQSDHSPSPSEPTITATLPPPGILEIRLELLLAPFGKSPFDSSQRL